jgi:flavin reductase (DIM6/NTAB) family NADH-FMN oxidoreductase RutF
MLTNLEQAAVALACEVESCISIGVPVTTALVNAVDRFRKVQQAELDEIGLYLDRLYKQTQQLQQLIPEGTVRAQPPLILVKPEEGSET